MDCDDTEPLTDQNNDHTSPAMRRVEKSFFLIMVVGLLYEFAHFSRRAMPK